MDKKVNFRFSLGTDRQYFANYGLLNPKNLVAVENGDTVVSEIFKEEEIDQTSQNIPQLAKIALCFQSQSKIGKEQLLKPLTKD